MKKLLLSLCGLASVCLASAQLSVGVNGNYTMYKGDFQQKATGFGLRVAYDVQEKMTAALSYTHGMPITIPSAVALMDGYGNEKSVGSEIKYNFKTINLLGQYSFAGDEESSGKFYGIVGLGYVLVSYDETIKESYDPNTYTAMDQVKGSESGFTLNVGLGGEYKIGVPRLFAEAGVALPANKVGNTYVENYIPAHFLFNAGVKFPLGSSSN